MTDFTIDRALTDKRLLGAELGDIASWQTWQVALKAAFALPLSPKERKIFTAIAGKRGLPKRRVRELWCVIGRGGGKSRMAAALGDYFALPATC
jgi:phage terminase large subunit-like protein